MKIFIAGATGVLGRRVISGLISSGHKVVGLSRSNKNYQVIHRLGAEPRNGNLFDKESKVSALFDCDVISTFSYRNSYESPKLSGGLGIK